jgi:diguanylate cyclase (GGDEF)-like protein
MKKAISSDGFKTLIQNPILKNDPRSCDQLNTMFTKIITETDLPLGTMLRQMTGIKSSEENAMEYWRRILENKRDMELKMQRRVGIFVAALDFMETHISPNSSNKDCRHSLKYTIKIAGEYDEIPEYFSPDSKLEILKNEMLRAKRYRHALAVILLDIDDFAGISEKLTLDKCEELLYIIIKIIRKTIRSVDIISRYKQSRFIVILPNTNKREAMELAERLRQNIETRTKRISGFESINVTSTIAAGQMSDVSSGDFIKHLELILANGKNKKNNAVYTLD